MTLRQYAAMVTVLAWWCLVAIVIEVAACEHRTPPPPCPVCVCPAPAVDRGGSDWAVELAGVLP